MVVAGKEGSAGVHAGRRRARLPRAHRIHERRGADADGGQDDSLRQPVLRPHGQMSAGAGDRRFLSPLSLRRRPGHAPAAPETAPANPAPKSRCCSMPATVRKCRRKSPFVRWPRNGSNQRDHRHGGDGHDGGPAQRGNAAGLDPPRGAGAGSRARARGPRIARQHHPAALRRPGSQPDAGGQTSGARRAGEERGDQTPRDARPDGRRSGAHLAQSAAQRLGRAGSGRRPARHQHGIRGADGRVRQAGLRGVDRAAARRHRVGALPHSPGSLEKRGEARPRPPRDGALEAAGRLRSVDDQ